VSDPGRVAGARRWLATRSPRTYLIAGWLVFVLGCYPGYLSFDSTMQLYAVRSGDYTDYAPVMTAIWSLFEYVASGPLPMLLLQSGLFLFGLAAILRRVLDPRTAAITAVCVLLFPPVFAPMAVIWPDSLMAGALLAGTALLLESTWPHRVGGGALLVVACACRPELVFALAPLVFVAIPPSARWRRAAIALGAVVGIALCARIGTWALTSTNTHRWEQGLLTDIVGTLRRAHVHDEQTLAQDLSGLPVVATAPIAVGHDAFDAWPLTHGERRIFDPIATDEQAAGARAVWRHVIAEHPGAFVAHRWAMTRGLLGVSGKWQPVYESFGDPALLAALQHRATVSDWQYGMQQIVDLFAATPLFRPWLYLLLAIGALAILRRTPLLRNLVISGVAYEIASWLFAPTIEYRFSHWLVITTCAALAATLARRIKR
jgi:hypothetical protein